MQESGKSAILVDMKMHSALILTLVCIALAVGSCGNVRYDSRLLAADSIINSAPDSALSMLRAVPLAEISSAADRAFYALLVTQAGYKCDEPIKSTDTIDRAIKYFTDSRDREKRTRSLIYKGAVLDELGDKTAAMLWYKQAEEAADPHDYFNLGYVNLRMASLYCEVYAESELDIDKYKNAYQYFTLSSNKKYQLICLSNIGKLYRAYDLDSAYNYLFKAIKLAEAINDTCSLVRNYSVLARAYYTDSLCLKSKDAAIYAIRNGAKYLLTNDCYYNLSRAYAILGNPDSAQYVLDGVTVDETYPAEKVSRYITLAEIAKARGNYRQAMRYGEMADSVSEIIEQTSDRKVVQEAETVYERQKAETKEYNYRFDKWMLVAGCTFIAAICIMALWLWHREKMRRFMSMMSQMKKVHIEELESLMLRNAPKIDKTVVEYFEKAKEFVDIYNAYNARPEKMLKKFNELATEFQDAGFYKSLRKIVDDRFDNLTKYLTEQYPKFKDRDIDIICMIICGFPNSLISFYVGYGNDKTIYNKRKILLNKLGDSSFEEFIARMAKISQQKHTF